MAGNSEKVLMKSAAKKAAQEEEATRPRGARTFTIEDELYQEFKIYCAQHNKTMSRILDLLIKAYLAEMKGK